MPLRALCFGTLIKFGYCSDLIGGLCSVRAIVLCAAILGFFCGLFSTSVSIWRCFVAESALYDSRMLSYVHVCSIIGVLGFVYAS